MVNGRYSRLQAFVRVIKENGPVSNVRRSRRRGDQRYAYHDARRGLASDTGHGALARHGSSGSGGRQRYRDKGRHVGHAVADRHERHVDLQVTGVLRQGRRVGRRHGRRYTHVRRRTRHYNGATSTVRAPYSRRRRRHQRRQRRPISKRNRSRRAVLHRAINVQKAIRTVRRLFHIRFHKAYRRTRRKRRSR